jgi:poly(glycerol-phosphate) alpha-glucosyltransferase
MKRIACVIDTISRKAGGLNASVQGLMSTMQRQGDEVRIFSVADELTQADRGHWSDFELYVAPSIGTRKYGYAPTLDFEIEAYKPDIVHSHGLWNYSSVAGMNWWRRTGGPVIIHPHGMLDPWALKNSRWRKRLVMMLYERRNLQQAACIRALCLSEMESVRALGLKNPVCVIPNGIDLPKLDSADPGALRPGRKLLLYLGRLHPKKGLELLIQAWGQRRQSQRLADWTLVIAGWDQGGHEDELKRLATKLGLAWSDLLELPDTETSLQAGLENPPSLVFVGPAFGLNKERLYRASDAFVLPSFSEGLPMVLLEAWSYGKPVLMTPMCNIPEGFASDAAIQIEPGVEAIGGGLETLAGLSDAARYAMGARGRGLVETQFAWDRVARRMREVNFWLVHQGSRPDSVFMCDA